MLCKFHSAWTETRKSISLLDFISHLISSVFITQQLKLLKIINNKIDDDYKTFTRRFDALKRRFQEL